MVAKIVITGGGTGGHFYPLIAVVDKIREISEEKKILQPKIFYMAEKPYNSNILFKNDIEFIKSSSGKLSLQPSFKTILEILKTIWGIADTFIRMIQIYPNVIFTNGGYVAFPILVSAKILRIPVIIHVSDTIPSRTLLFAKKSAKKIFLAFGEAARYFPKDKIVLVGNPVRDEIKFKEKTGASQYFNLDQNIPTILILGGSQGSKIINNTIMKILPKLLENYQVIHQTGKEHYEEIYGIAGVILINNTNKNKYRIYSYLDNLQIKMAAGAANLVIARAGSGTIFEIANWQIPAILIPLTKVISRDQESNSYSYARSGSAVVIRQKNLTPNILFHEINRIFTTENLMEKMKEGAINFFKADAEKKIAVAILDILISQQK